MGSEQETLDLFRKLSPENQNNLLAFARLAHVAENSVRKSLIAQLEQESQVEKSEPLTDHRAAHQK